MKISRIVLLGLLISLLVSACGGAAPALAPTVELPTLTPTEIPSLTPLPPATRVLIVSSGGLPAGDIESITAQAQSLAAASGLAVETIPAITPDMLTPDVKLVIVLPQDPGVSDLASRFPSILFITIAIPGIQPAGNLFTIAADGDHPEWIGFLAGYIATIITYDYRVGTLVQAGSNAGVLTGDAFRNGVVYFCGICRKQFSPFEYLPPVIEMNPAPTEPEWLPWADAFVATAVKTAYIDPEVANPDMLAYLATKGLKLIGSQTPPDNLRPAWVATINMDYTAPLVQAWSEALAGSTGRSLSAGVKVLDVDPNLLGDGKMRLVNQTIELLTSGAIGANTIQ